MREAVDSDLATGADIGHITIDCFAGKAKQQKGGGVLGR